MAEKNNKKNLNTSMHILLIVSATVRLILAFAFPLGIDEAYYYVYAKFPDWSHFDHPSMVGWVIQLFTCNLRFNHEVFIRLAAIVAGTINTWVIFQIGKTLRDELTGWYAALLYTASIYGFVIAGTFILPDAPQSVFWLLALLLLLKAFKNEVPNQHDKKMFILASFCIGLGMLSKYTAAFLWIGTIAYLVLYKRKWLKTPHFYYGQLITLIVTFPILYWNLQNDFISFRFHGARVEPLHAAVNFSQFLTEWLGEFFYNNPMNWLLICMVSIMSFKQLFLQKNNPSNLLLLTGLPLILLFLFISLFRSTLPHWNGIGYLTLIPLVALWMRQKFKKTFPLPLKISLSVISLVLIVVSIQIITGIIPIDKIMGTEKNKLDITLDMYGWRTLQDEFPKIAAKYEQQQLMQVNAPIIIAKWFPGASLDYYLTRNNQRKVLAAGDTIDIHEYAWINKKNGGFQTHSDGWYITSSLSFKPPTALKNVVYNSVILSDTININRCNEYLYSFYIFRLKKLQYEFVNRK